MKKPTRKLARRRGERDRAGAASLSETSRRPDLAALEKALGYGFADRSLLERALTHASSGDGKRGDNQRLEFLGDRVLALMTTEALLSLHPDAQEGDLAPRLNALVRGETCAEVAQELNVGAHLRMARSEALSGGRRKSALLGDAMEALIAAVYLDGGLDAARTVFDALWGRRLREQGDAEVPIDAKTALQEWAQARGLAPPVYRLVGRDGPDHAPLFTVEAQLPTGAAAQAKGASKRVAEQTAAATLLSTMTSGDPNSDKGVEIE